MANDYLSFFNLNDDPFHLTPDTAYFYNSPEHATALLSLEYCISQKVGFCILTGEPGTGKTTIQRIFTEKWKDRAEIALVMTPRLSADEFFLAILDDFKIPLSSSKNEMLKAFRSFLLTHAANDKRVAIIVDEAQELPESTLEELRLLSNMETEKEKLLQIILIGQPELRRKLLGEPLRQLNQRITVRVQLEPLSSAETSDYINTRLIKGGNTSLLYDQKAKDLIYHLSGGIPRTINLLASRGLMSAFLDNGKVVLEKHVQKGATDVMEPLASKNIPRPAIAVERRSLAAPVESAVTSVVESPLRRLADRVLGLVFARKKPDIVENYCQPATNAAGKSNSNPSKSRPTDMLSLEMGYGLAPMLDDAQDGELYERLRFIRRQTAHKMGFDVPAFHIHNNLQLKPYEYNLLIYGARVGGSELTGQYLAMDSGAVTAEIAGISTKEPIYGLPAVWIQGKDCEQAQINGYTIVDSSTVVATHISELIKHHSHELVGQQEMQQLLDKVAVTAPKVVDELIPNLLNLDTVLQVVINLLKEGGSIRDMRSILESLAINASRTKDPGALTDLVLQGLGGIIVDQYKAG